jgi:hypothetical protein
MNREMFCEIAPLVIFTCFVLPEPILIAVMCFVAGAATACKFSLDAEEREKRKNDLPAA